MDRRRFLFWREAVLMFILTVVFISFSSLQINVKVTPIGAIYLNLTTNAVQKRVRTPKSADSNPKVSACPRSSESRSHANNSSRIKVIVLSYIRSGSTLCGDLLQAHPDVFYVYEPLLYLWDYYVPTKHHGKADFRLRTKDHWRKTKPFTPPPLDFLGYMFNCNMTVYNIEFLTNVNHSEDFRTARCVSNKRSNILANLTKACVNCVREKCVTSKAILQKVVRLTMAEADQYLERDPTVRIIHLIRDPRGVLLSRMHFNKKISGEMHNNYTYICQRLRDDIKVSREISHKHWGKILTLRYEDMAQDLLRATEIMYSFIGLDMLPAVRNYVRKVTSYEAVLPNGKTAAKQTARKNPFKTAYNWRLELPFSLVKQVDHTCKYVLDNMGYVTFTSEEKLRDMNQPAKLENYGYGLMTV